MIVSPIERAATRCLAALLGALILIPTPAAWAQQGDQRLGAPVQLHPGNPAAAPQEEQTVPIVPAAREAGGNLESRRLPGRAVKPGKRAGGIEISRLRAFDPAAVGLLGEDDGGLGADMWAGSRLDAVVALLSRLPVDGHSPVMHDLARRLLLTGARVPEGDGKEGSDLLLARLDRLAAGGWTSDVAALLQRAPPALEAPGLLRARLDGFWLAGDRDGACAMAFNMIDRSNAPVWLKSAAFCHALDGDADRVALYEELLLEADAGTRDEPYHALLGAASGRDGKPLESLPAPEPLHLAMLRAVDWPLPADAMSNASAPIARHMVENDGTPEALRLEAAERAAQSRVLPIARLRELYALARFEAPERAAAEEWAEANPGARANALLYQTARARKRPVDRARFLASALRGARASGRFAVVARANKTALMTLRPVPGLIDFAAEAGRALLVADEPELALSWYRLVEEGGDPGREAAWRSLWPGMLVADEGARVPLDPERFVAWWRASGSAEAAERMRHAVLLLTLLEALGQTVPEATWALLYADAETTRELAASPVLLRGLARAAETGRRGETVLLALTTLGREGPAGAAPATLAAVIEALRRLGFEAEARAVALEAVLAREF